MFFLFDAEALFFINNNESKIFPLGGGGEQSVGADGYGGFAALNGGASSLLIFGANETREQMDVGLNVGKAVLESVEVLLDEKSSGSEDGHLLAILDDVASGAQCEFSFAEANVTDNQTIHGFSGSEISYNFLPGALLVAG